MDRITSFGEAQNVAITVLVDNRADLFVKSTDYVSETSRIVAEADPKGIRQLASTSLHSA